MNKFDIKRIINQLIGNLLDRSKDIVLSRFGIGKERYETLDAIGKRYGITRERVRQIEADALKRITVAENESLYKPVIAALADFVKSRGGVVEETALKTDFAASHFEVKAEPVKKYEGAVILFLNLKGGFVKAKEDDNFKTRWALDAAAVKTQEGLVGHLVDALRKEKRPVNFDGLVSWAKSHRADLNADIVRAHLASANALGQNNFGEWGLIAWPEITPRGVRDKAFLIMQRVKEPLHFTKVAEEINKASFSDRVALPQTVHNELIKDERFVLVGRGTYALKDWGYQTGTVKDIIKEVLSENGPLNREQVVEAVLAKRLVKPGTIVLNLGAFKKRADNRYVAA
ncbi:MAG: sigma factor-like helix-turn-helix DNA-binding protein [Patescibacteria group bacterium]